ncbi:uncharacterized protein BP5553_04783 [Venustampulla echinocandica]|uniref:tRNA(Ile)-lysidine synthetase n=1 Tax=Venustampulla echinocandica TaxID=2656787 RepID=A0A370TP95_9HELO|nr:uncharacterized protein BP5553_04783 [Venustampulla echinocandica]RDL37350.1 hypothetical protein BP5553_04783 [Venustampulla echinocandica]
MGVSSHVFKAQASTARPLAVAEFLSSLSKICTTAESSHRGQAETFGLAISGGVDSMALATLCSQLQSTYPGTGLPPLGSLRKIDFRAFVVDHGVRAGSTSEANSVARLLEGRGAEIAYFGQALWLTRYLGIQTQVLQINWPGCDNPADKPNFESLARKYRYQIMGKACKDLGIRSLLLAHHEDDQAETILMRLIKGHGRLGLMGMKVDGGIPECYGIHGVYESGGIPIQSPLIEPHSEHNALAFPQNSEQMNLFYQARLPIETGGIKIYRPLLSVGKERLIATCQAEGMEWFEDHTNKDPTLTTRNAIRHMYKSYYMPAALTKPALLELSARCRAVTNSELEVTKQWLARCDIRTFDNRTSILDIRFPDLKTFANTQQADGQLLAANIIRYIVMLVTPEEHVSLSFLNTAVERVFREVMTSKKNQRKPPMAFTVAGVEFRPIIEGVSHARHQGSKPPVEEKCRWLISRQPYNSSSETHPSILVPPPHSPLENTWSEWTLYDGRYWIRIKNRGPMPVLVRPFRKEHLHRLLRPPNWIGKGRRLKQILKRIAPGASRWTIPALVLRGNDAKEVPFALPSLDFRDPDLGAEVDWEIRYKKLYTDGLPQLHSTLEV